MRAFSVLQLTNEGRGPMSLRYKVVGIALAVAAIAGSSAAVASAEVFHAQNGCHIAVPQTTPESFYTGDVTEVFQGNIERLVCVAHLTSGPGVSRVTVIDNSIPGVTVTDTLLPNGVAIERSLEVF